jgi:hypothetical protein
MRLCHLIASGENPAITGCWSSAYNLSTGTWKFAIKSICIEPIFTRDQDNPTEKDKPIFVQEDILLGIQCSLLQSYESFKYSDRFETLTILKQHYWKFDENNPVLNIDCESSRYFDISQHFNPNEIYFHIINIKTRKIVQAINVNVLSHFFRAT